MIFSPIDEIKNQLLEEIEILKNERGFIKAGQPRFDRLFGRDSLIVSWQLLDFDPEICKATLKILAQLQGKEVNDGREEEPGKIIHETDLEKKWHPEGYHPFPYYGSVDSTPLFLILFSFYYKKTRDRKFLDSHWENILMALNWIKEYGDKDRDYFLEYERKTPKGLFHQAWKDDFENHLKIKPPIAIVEAQGYQYLALKGVAELAEILGDYKISKELLRRANFLKKVFNQKFWMPDKKYFALALDGDKNQKKTITSNPGHLLFTDIVEKNKIKPTVRRLFEKDMWTPFGIRTHSLKEPNFDPKSYHLGSIWPHDNWIIAQGFKKSGYKKEYQEIQNAFLRAYQEIGFLPEFYGVLNGKITLELKEKPCYPQAWATGALFNFLQKKKSVK